MNNPRSMATRSMAGSFVAADCSSTDAAILDTTLLTSLITLLISVISSIVNEVVPWIAPILFLISWVALAVCFANSLISLATTANPFPASPARAASMVAFRACRFPRTPPKFLTASEKRRLLKELRGSSTLPATRDRVIIELFLGTGIRLQELVGLDIDDVDLDAKHLRVRAKGDVPQVKFLKSGLRSLLRGYLVERRRIGDGEYRALFLSNRGTRISPGQVANRVKHWLLKTGIRKDLGPHGLRHTFATHLYAATSDLLVVKRALGHRDISTTEIYTHLVDGALEEALERL